jgi:hypothetical protein
MSSTIWQPNTPATVNENLNVSAPKINSNFNTIGYGFEQDHNALGNTSNVGQHNQSTYITQVIDPVQDPNNIRLFAKLVNSIPQLFLQYPTSVTGGTIPIVTAALAQFSTVTVPTNFINGFFSQTECSFDLGGLILKIGTITGTVTGQTITFGANNQSSPVPLPASAPFPNTFILMGLIATQALGFAGWSFSGANTAGFVFNGANSGSFMYIAIGS